MTTADAARPASTGQRYGDKRLEPPAGHWAGSTGPNTIRNEQSVLAGRLAGKAARGNKAIGTTGRGIGPCYEDKVSRRGIRLGEMLDPDVFQERLREQGLEVTIEPHVKHQIAQTLAENKKGFGARPLRRAIMKYLEDTLAEQCLSKTLYPNTKIYVRRKKVEGTLMTYTNELEVEIDFSDVDTALLEQSLDNDQPVPTLAKSDYQSEEDNFKSPSDKSDSPNVPSNIGLGSDEPKPTIAGRAYRFFRKKS